MTAECMDCEKELPNHDPRSAEICEDCAETKPASDFLMRDWINAVDLAYGSQGFKR